MRDFKIDRGVVPVHTRSNGNHKYEFARHDVQRPLFLHSFWNRTIQLPKFSVMANNNINLI